MGPLSFDFQPSSGKEATARLSQQQQQPAKEQRRLKDHAGSYSAVTAFRQWRRNNATNSAANRSSSVPASTPATTPTATLFTNGITTQQQQQQQQKAANGIGQITGTTITGTWPPGDPATLKKLEQFPLVQSDATMPEEDLSLKFLALVSLIAPAAFSFIRRNYVYSGKKGSDVLNSRAFLALHC